ncbi:hypothetical protein, variant [Aphanomyces astaci]|uniref:FH2 domain-containing protein n=1 Tax=Aphanomyces astaci TaxID=112090 RepID=W4H3I1_APHAT|nr:hypothetical protein, variant [Aphanomyces astaci]ETV85708.1 hypothetical protein, variant [Aphanomyces astaci]|eukprot:XP_009824180.1 hypothetical protein, variant [Aphanomyces astaci]
MSFLAELSKRQGKPQGSVKPFGFARALHLDGAADATTSMLPPFMEKKTPSQTFASPFAKSAIEILQELERKADEEQQQKQQPQPEDDTNFVRTKPQSTSAAAPSLMERMSRRTLNTTVLDSSSPDDTSNQSDNDITTTPVVVHATPHPPSTTTRPSKPASMLEELMLARKKAAQPASPSHVATAPKPTKHAMLEQLMQKRTTPTSHKPPTTTTNAGSKHSTMLEPRLQPPSASASPHQTHQQQQPSPTSSTASTESSYSSPSSSSTSAANNNTDDLDHTSSTSTSVPLKDHPKYATYFVMLKRGLPKPAVQHRMLKDQVDPSILDLDPELPLVEHTLATDPAYEKYFKMLKTGLPRPVVEHKLTADGVSIHLLSLDPTMPTVPKTQLDAAFAKHKDNVVLKYRKMLKMGMPPLAVDHAMAKDGVDPSWLHPNAAATTNSTKATFLTRQKKSDKIRKKLHWVVLNKDAMHDSTLWKQPSQATLSEASVVALERLFTKSVHDQATKAMQSDLLTAAKSSRDLQVKSISLMDMKKAQNIGITLARIKVPFEKIKDEILNMNPTVMSSMHLKALIDLWPDTQEMKAIRDFPGEPQTLGLAERFCYVMRDTPRFTEKLQCLIFKQEFLSRSHELRETILLVVRCVHQICTSDDLRDILLLVLNMGNVLNFGKDAPHAAAKGFSLSSLVKLSQTKAFVGQTTLLQFLVEVVDRDAPHLAQFDEEVGLLERASRVVTQQLYSEKKALEAGRAHLEAEAQRILGEDHETNLTAAAIRFFITKVDLELKDLTEQLDALNQKVRNKQFCYRQFVILVYCMHWNIK